ncbi:hypothetical protein PspKH34_04430 [Parageobacillus sp. KH3-4]|nr:hypothetical protein PspKH34_04430 [Parageobacillus sp. KH3-4]
MKFNIIRCARAVLRVTDLNASRDFYERALGFVVTEADSNHLYLRGLEEYHHHSLLLKKAEQPSVEVISYKVYSEEDLEALYDFFQQKQMNPKWIEEGQQHAIGRSFRVQDVSGLPLEFFVKMDTIERLLQRYDLYRGARVQRIDHFNCMVTDVQTAYDFYVKELGFACSEYTETEDRQLWAAWLHRKPNVHDVAFMNGKGPRPPYWLLAFRSAQPNSRLRCACFDGVCLEHRTGAGPPWVVQCLFPLFEGPRWPSN